MISQCDNARSSCTYCGAYAHAIYYKHMLMSIIHGVEQNTNTVNENAPPPIANSHTPLNLAVVGGQKGSLY